MCAKDVKTHDQVGPTFSVLRLAGMTYQRGSKSKLFSIRTRLSLGQRALPRLDLGLSCLYSLASFIECSLAWLFQQDRTVHLLRPLKKNQNNGKVTENR